MKRLFEVVTEHEWEVAAHKASKHLDILQVLAHLAEFPEDITKLRAEPGKAESKRHVLLEYAARKGVAVETLSPREGWIYVRLHREALGRPGRKKFSVAGQLEWETAHKKVYRGGRSA